MKPACLSFLIVLAGILTVNSNPAFAGSGLTVNVEVIKAMQNSSEVDPELSGLVSEVGPVLNYKGFKLLRKSSLPLKKGDSEELLLSRNRRLTLKLDEFEGDQARLHLKIYKNKTEIFATTLIMVDNGSAIIGGPKLKKGVMLLRIHGKFN